MCVYGSLRTWVGCIFTSNQSSCSHVSVFITKAQINENEIRIATQGRMHNYTTYAITLVQEKGVGRKDLMGFLIVMIRRKGRKKDFDRCCVEKMEVNRGCLCRCCGEEYEQFQQKSQEHQKNQKKVFFIAIKTCINTHLVFVFMCFVYQQS